ncbi:Holliday junction resolvase RecU [Lactococcus garvieae]|jgi:recombination protein U|uniref:Holliday junction resolvase RecU n=1 Tax=Lactococcus garvieae DCC43 TaxID=1231377 RepID=K2NUV2_9LACT|nr:Holliday junction resolvase RecU [Lactococcus garvieae]EKF51313.1 Recombination protein RecU [Lactococcus garvieae DCC43]QPS71135.1 Holliday junction resolvase RecU [Lactococcus garvieae]
MLKYPQGLNKQGKHFSNEKVVKKTEHNTAKNVSNMVKSKTAVKFGKRGMNFEAEINATNDYYLSRNIAVIHKKPTPIQIVKVDYPQRSRAKITEAYFRQASTTDYSGVYRGRYIDFEAKETQQKTSFPLKNFHEHQIVHMTKVLEQKGIAFVLLHFASLGETYYLPSENLISFYHEKKGLKSIPLDYIKKHAYPLSSNQIPRIPYLEIVNQLCEVN